MQGLKLVIVVPCLNEGDTVSRLVKKVLSILDDLRLNDRLVGEGAGIVLVDDGSTDDTWEIIRKQAHGDSRVRGLRLARNYGHQNALLAGIHAAEADVVITIDADLQDDPSIIREMLLSYLKGYEVVYGVRRRRDHDGKFKKLSASLFYRLMKSMGVDLVEDHSDYRLLGKQAIERLGCYKETNLFLRGIVPLLGGESARVYYDRQPRTAGSSKYSLAKMLSFALEGITSFSVVPLRIVAILGLGISTISAGLVFWVLLAKMFSNSVVPGWASSVLPIYFLGGVQILAIGVIGEYVGRIYLEVKSRPRYFISERT